MATTPSAPRIVNAYIQLRAAVASSLLPESRAVGIFPSHNSSRSGDGPQDGWLLASPFFATDPSAPWYNHGARWFGFHRYSPALPSLTSKASSRAAAKKAALQAAFDYCATHYELTDFVRNSTGEYVPAVVALTFPIAASLPPPSSLSLS